jgi:rare lipoprotein A
VQQVRRAAALAPLASALLLLGCARAPAPAPARPAASAGVAPRTTSKRRRPPPPPRPVEVAARPATPPAEVAPADSPPSAGASAEEGMATWYGGRHHGGPTASGERFDTRAMTAAHRTLPMGTRVRVTHQKNGRSVVVRINDRGPFGNKRRIIDVSEAAARQLDMIDEGVAPVRVEVVEAAP